MIQHIAIMHIHTTFMSAQDPLPPLMNASYAKLPAYNFLRDTILILTRFVYYINNLSIPYKNSRIPLFSNNLITFKFIRDGVSYLNEDQINQLQKDLEDGVLLGATERRSIQFEDEDALKEGKVIPMVPCQ